MANIIRKKAGGKDCDDDGEEVDWVITVLEKALFDLSGLADILQDGSHDPPGPQIVRVDVGVHEECVLIAGRSTRVNGLVVETGIRKLEPRDEITVGGGDPAYFSTEDPARVVPFPGADRPVHCPRCRLVIEPGSPAVRCPRCFVWHHQSEEYPCWTLEGAETCAACREHPNTLDGRPDWLPKD